MRLIDADAFIVDSIKNKRFVIHTEDFKNDSIIVETVYGDLLDAINSTPTVDAVEVVRCRDCKRRGIAGKCPMCYTEDAYDEDYGYDYWDVDKTVDDGFCHCGEKWDAEDEG
jgi:hypothetical protein